MARDKLLKKLSLHYGYKRLTQRLRLRFEGDLRSAMLRKIAESNGDMIDLATKSLSDYDRDIILQGLNWAMKREKVDDTDAFVKGCLDYLGFERASKRNKEIILQVFYDSIESGDLLSFQSDV